MIDALDKFIAVLFRLMRAVLTVMLLAMVAILMAHIWFRYVLNHSLTWSEELMKILLVWFGMLSVGVLAVRREHVAIVVFKEHMPKAAAAFCDKVAQLLTVVICIVVVVVGAWYALNSGARLTPALRIPYSWAYAAIPVSFVPVAFFEFRNMLVDFTGKGKYAAIDKPEEDLSGGQEISL